MRTQIICIACIFFLIGGWLGIIKGRQTEKREWEKSLQEISREYEQLLLLERIIKLESAGRHDIWGDEGKSYGLCQFSEQTFIWMVEKSGIKGLKWEDDYSQLVLLRWAIENGYGKHWSTYSKAKEQK